MTTVRDAGGRSARGEDLRHRPAALPGHTPPPSAPAPGTVPPGERAVVRTLGHLLFLTPDADGYGCEPGEPAKRGELGERNAKDPTGHVAVARVGPGGGTLRQGGRTLRLEGGRLVVWDTRLPYRVAFPPGTRTTVCLVPRAALRARAGVRGSLVPIDVPPASPSGGVLRTLVDALARCAGDCPEPVARQLADAVTDLLAALVLEHAGEDAPAERQGGRLAGDIRAYVDRHLTDPLLGPRSIAAAHHMSVRALHKLFVAEGVTVSRLIRRRRLEECARELLSAGRAWSTIAGVARSWGFVNPAHFSRLFRSEYGMSPSRWRAATTPRNMTGPSRTATADSLLGGLTCRDRFLTPCARLTRGRARALGDRP
jgi:AraC-like DNA-binding protein